MAPRRLLSCKMVGLFQQAIEFSWIYLSGVLTDLGSGDSACCESISVFCGASHFCARAIHCGVDGRCHTLCIVSGGSYGDRCGYSGTEQETYEAGYIRANMRVISDKISDSLATTTIDTVQKVGEGKVQAALARAEFKEATEEKVNKSIETLRKNKADLQKEFDELSSSIVEHTFVGQGRLIKAFPDMKHRDYLEVVQELKNKMRDRK